MNTMNPVTRDTISEEVLRIERLVANNEMAASIAAQYLYGMWFMACQFFTSQEYDLQSYILRVADEYARLK